MSRMNELATALDELTEVGHRLVACGEDLIKAAARVKECFSADEEEAKPAKTPGRRRAAKTPEPEQEPEPAAEPEKPAPKTYTKEEVRAMLADLSQSGHRDEAKALVKKYADGGSLTDIDPARYPDLVQEVLNCHG